MTDIVATSNNIFGNAGIESTPVIDRATNTLYLVARTKENGAYVQRTSAAEFALQQSRNPYGPLPKPLRPNAVVPADGSARDPVRTLPGTRVPGTAMARMGSVDRLLFGPET